MEIVEFSKIVPKLFNKYQNEEEIKCYREICVIHHVNKDGKKEKYPINELNNISLDTLKTKGGSKISLKKGIEYAKEKYDLKYKDKFPREILDNNNHYICDSIYLKYLDYKVIDIDEDIEYKVLIEIEPLLKKLPYVVGNNKGYHFYFKLKSQIDREVKERDVFKNFKGDLIGFKNNIWEKKGKVMNNYDKNIGIPIIDYYTDIIPLLKKESKEENKEENKEVNNEEKKPYIKTHILSKDQLDFMKKMEWPLLIKFFEECYDHDKRQKFDSWIKIGISLKNRYGDDGFELFEIFSNLNTRKDKIDDHNKLLDTYNNICRNYKIFEKDPITIKSLYYYAKEDNKDKYVKIMLKYSPFKEFSLTSTDIAKYIKMFKPNEFLWKDNKLYCFNGRYWENNDIPLLQYISNELFEFLQEILISCFWEIDKDEFMKKKNKLDKLKSLPFKKEIVETTKEYMTNNEIEFDSKYYLFAFKNSVYDLRQGKFLDSFNKNDYISINTGYDWIEPTVEQIEKVNSLINTIFRSEKERRLFLEILATGLEGACLEKFIVFNGSGRNGKGLIDDFYLKALGNYGMMGNNAILFEKNKTGANPEKEKINKKRYVVFREPSAKSKFENSIVKELTGGGNFSARDLHDSNITKKLHLTMIVECNKRPQFAEDPDRAEAERVIDILFENTFVDDPSIVNENKNIYLANKEYKEEEFQTNYKYALLKILFDVYKGYKNRNRTFDIPESVKQRTKTYLEMSSSIISWMNDNYERTNSKEDIISLKNVFDKFKDSEYYFNLSKTDKRKYNYQYFITQFSENVLYEEYYISKTSEKNNILIKHKEIIKEK